MDRKFELIGTDFISCNNPCGENLQDSESIKISPPPSGYSSSAPDGAVRLCAAWLAPKRGEERARSGYVDQCRMCVIKAKRDDTTISSKK